MQDRLKFRVVYYNDVEKKYFIFEPDLISAEGTARAYAYGESGADEYYDTVTLNQCTGLKDKNSKLIYEGDRVYIDCEDETAIIKWSDDLARFTIHFEDEAVFADFDNYYSKELEVIGNIYENSELPKE